MNKITSFQVDHTKMHEGLYISRIDGDITTYDMRTRKPNAGTYMDNGTMHTFEHMFATFVRNSAIADSIIYFGPMGCQTGFYLLVRGAENKVVIEIIKDILKNIISYHGEVFGCSEIECGNFRTLDLSLAVEEAKRYYETIKNITEKDLSYPV
ncbi:MAG: S-ribosylhomocysteine lyase [Bacillota bacterium]|nr:S-ribosylhomocysteine lyase [Bacillota bacterium]